MEKWDNLPTELLQQIMDSAMYYRGYKSKGAISMMQVNGLPPRPWMTNTSIKSSTYILFLEFILTIPLFQILSSIDIEENVLIKEYCYRVIQKQRGFEPPPQQQKLLVAAKRKASLTVNLRPEVVGRGKFEMDMDRNEYTPDMVDVIYMLCCSSCYNTKSIDDRLN
jgi:hypothetical protein